MTNCELHLKHCQLEPLFQSLNEVEEDREIDEVLLWGDLLDEALEDGDSIGDYDGDLTSLRF